jgi:Flp pilus assembly protein TadB
MALKIIKVICFIIFLSGIPALIVSSIAGNNEGWVVTFGMVTAIAALILIAVSAVSAKTRIDTFDEVIAERIEQRVRGLVASGAPESDVRALIRDAIELSRGQQ